VADPVRVVAVDWTGAKEPVKNLWLAEARAGELTEVRRFDRRAELVEYVIAEGERDPRLVVGFDFAFSLPGWFLERQALRGARELWGHMAERADDWLAPRPPFWRDADSGRPGIDEEFRQTDLDLRARGLRPASPFKLVGPNQVGRGSLRGMRHLAELARAGFNVWPFSAGLPLVVEIYPAAYTAATRKSDPERIAQSVRRDRRIPETWKAHAACSQDAFDAAMSALAMAEHAEQFERLAPAPRTSRYAREGRIWIPASGDR